MVTQSGKWAGKWSKHHINMTHACEKLPLSIHVADPQFGWEQAEWRGSHTAPWMHSI